MQLYSNLSSKGLNCAQKQIEDQSENFEKIYYCDP